MQQAYAEAAQAFVNQLFRTIDEHVVVFDRSAACASNSDTYPTLLEVKDEESVESPFPNLLMSYKIESAPKKDGITTDYAITISGDDHEGLFLEVLRLISEAHNSKATGIFTYNWRQREEEHCITGYTKKVK